MKKLFLMVALILCIAAVLAGCADASLEATDDTDVDIDTVEETELYQKFLHGEMDATIHSEYFGDEEYFAIDPDDVESIERYGFEDLYENSKKIGDTVTFSDLKQYIYDEYVYDRYGNDGPGMELHQISYAYITCGGGDHQSLIVRFSSIREYFGEDVFFVFNEENGVLYLTYSFASWGRSQVEATSSGLLSRVGASSAGTTHFCTSVLDENAIRHKVVEENIYSGEWIMDLDVFHDAYQKMFGWDDIPLSISEYLIGDETYYTYEVEATSSSEMDKIERFLSSCGVTWWTKDEIDPLIVQRKEGLQLPDSVYDDDTSIEWIAFETDTTSADTVGTDEQGMSDTSAVSAKESHTLYDAQQVLVRIFESYPGIDDATVTTGRCTYYETLDGNTSYWSSYVSINGMDLSREGPLGEDGYLLDITWNDEWVQFYMHSADDLTNYWVYDWSGNLIHRFSAYEDVYEELPKDVGIAEYFYDVICQDPF